ncbi:MAG TPA: hypothetical protein VLA93_13160 [Pyrinomonadaceae bacterium]|nr:hypothetical protein [Pyrinomonadaceae bacterium]
MITGFNTDIEYEGVVYHVQTEDKGLDSPVILSLVYAGGAILASKRSPYEDLIREGYSDEALAERLMRQHRLICAAIHTGRINDLKKMSGRGVAPKVGADTEPAPPLELDDTIEPTPVPFELEVGSKRSQEYQPPPPPSAETEEVPANAEEEKTQVRPSPRRRKEALSPEPIPDQGLVVRLLDNIEFYAGETPTLRVLVTNREGQQENPVGNAAVSIKVLGTTFRPLIYSLKTHKDGIATVSTQIPKFTSGRAAVLIKASAKDKAAEVRCIIHPNR